MRVYVGIHVGISWSVRLYGQIGTLCIDHFTLVSLPSLPSFKIGVLAFHRITAEKRSLSEDSAEAAIVAAAVVAAAVA